jgi:ADP-heptose:LPS heptosyltransferase
MGDVLLSTPAIPNIKMALPDACVDVVTRPELNEKDIFTGNPYINEIIVFSKRKLLLPVYFSGSSSNPKEKIRY